MGITTQTTTTQSIMLGTLNFWLASRKSMSGPGFIIIVVETTTMSGTGLIDDKNGPILSESAVAALKLGWNNVQPSIPPPKSTKLERFLLKNDFLTNRQPLQAKWDILHILGTKIAEPGTCNLHHWWLQLIKQTYQIK